MTRRASEYVPCRSIILIFLLIGPFLSMTALADTSYRPDQLLVKFRTGIAPERPTAIARTHGVTKVKAFKRPRKLKRSSMDHWRVIKLGKGQNILKLKEALAKDPAVERVEFDYLVSIHAKGGKKPGGGSNAGPTDTRFDEQWALHNIGQTGGTVDADIDALEAWSIHDGRDSGVMIAVIDTGVDYTHKDLSANIWTNPGETPNNGIDDDGNGYVDDVHGYNFDNNFGLNTDPQDDNGHGTHVAGIIAAEGNNRQGIAGVSWGGQIMALKFLDSEGFGSISAGIEATLYAADMGAQVLNNSWSLDVYSQALNDAIETTYQAGAVYVAAAGNSGSNNDLRPTYPASHEVPNVIAVAATDDNDGLASFSSFGLESVDLGAPGVGILSTISETGPLSDPSGYQILNGTSMSAPHVSGAAALLLSLRPNLTSVGMKELLVASADPVPSLNGKTVSGGRLNVNAAMQCENRFSFTVTDPREGFIAFSTTPIPIRSTVYNCGQGVADASIVVQFSNGDVPLTLFDDGEHGDDAAGDGVYGNTWTPVNVAQTTLTITASQASLGSVTQTVSGEVIKSQYRVEQVPFQWIDASAGEFLEVDRVPLGFDFDFFGITYNEVLATQ